MQRLPIILFAAASAAALPASATMVSITVENLAPDDGLFFSPVWMGFHDGSFDAFDVGAAASPGIEDIAELGAGATLGSELLAADPSGFGLTLTNPAGPGGVIFDPGSSVSMQVMLDSSMNQFLSIGAMVVPSNDIFLGNAEPIELFNDDGEFLGADLMFSVSMLWDSGTEVNDIHDGGAFVPGSDAMMGTSEGGVIHSADFAYVLGETTAANTILGTISGPLVRLHIEAVPEPGLIGPLAGAFLFLPLLLRRRRR